MKKKHIITVFNWLLVVICMTAIFLFSHQDSSQSGELSGNISEAIYGPIVETFPDTDVTEESIHISLRMLGHFGLFMLLGATLINALYRDLKDKRYAVLFSILGAMLYAVTDETHQIFVPGRTFEIFDILIDSLGATVGVMILYLIFNTFLKNKSDTENQVNT